MKTELTHSRAAIGIQHDHVTELHDVIDERDVSITFLTTKLENMKGLRDEQCRLSSKFKMESDGKTVIIEKLEQDLLLSKDRLDIEAKNLMETEKWSQDLWRQLEDQNESAKNLTVELNLMFKSNQELESKTVQLQVELKKRDITISSLNKKVEHRDSLYGQLVHDVDKKTDVRNSVTEQLKKDIESKNKKIKQQKAEIRSHKNEMKIQKTELKNSLKEKALDYGYHIFTLRIDMYLS